jgi:adenylate kinase
VPDDITIPMILNRLKEDDCKKGWLLDGFPRNKVQAQTLAKALKDAGIALDYVIEIELDRQIAKERIMGRRLCANDNNHPNHIAFDAIKPVEKDGKLVCRVCGGDLNTRADDQDETAIGKRHNIYYDTNTGTMAAVNSFKGLSGTKVLSVDGSASIKEVTDLIMKQLS